MNALKTFAATVLWFGLCVLTVSACRAGWNDVDPRSLAPVPGNPCGIHGVPCLDSSNGFNGSCCSEGETCDPSSCPAGMCCDIDDSQGGTYGKKRPRRRAWQAE